jgi:hypothetical protein
MAEADLPELKDCPKCSGGMKLCEFPFFLSLARSEKGSYHAADDGIAIYPYMCLSCFYVELYTNPNKETARRKPPRYHE